MIEAEVVYSADEKVLEDIVSINRKALPAHWGQEGAREYYAEKIKDRNNICILLKEGDKRGGHLFAIPHNDAVEELLEDDPLMEKDDRRYYIEIVGIIPEFRGKKGFTMMLETLIEELKRRGINKISLHARISNNFSKIVQNKLRVTKIRRIGEWAYYNYEEPTDYTEGEVN